jgi:PAS domain S-box-containing protein
MILALLLRGTQSVNPSPATRPEALGQRTPSTLAERAAALLGIGIVYFLLAKAGLSLASIHPSATPIWPPTGFALAAVLLFGYRVWPAIFLGAFLANATTAGSLATSGLIAVGNTLEGLIGGFLINRWSGGRATFDTPTGVAKFALISLAPGPMVSATVGVTTLSMAGYADWANFMAVWMTWWLGDVAGALVVAPVLLLWATDVRRVGRNELMASGATFLGAAAIGVIAFSPLIAQTPTRGVLAFLAIVPLLWAALRRNQRDTATVALILSAFAVWGGFAQGGPFAATTLNDTFLLLLAFMISITVPSLVLSADVRVRTQTEEGLRRAHGELDTRVQQRTAALAEANQALHTEVEARRLIEAEREQQRVQLLEAQRLAHLGSWVWDMRQGKVTWSAQLFSIYGLEPEQFGGTIDDFLAHAHDEDRERIGRAIGQALESGGGFQLAQRIVRPDGEIRYLQSCGEVIRDEHGEPLQMLGICQDVTEQKRAESALEHARDQLAQSQKLEALGQLTGGIAHDFNNLLMIVSGHAELLRRRLTEARDLRAIDAVRAAASRGESLTRQLLTFSRRQRLEPLVVDLRERIEAVRHMLGSTLHDTIRLDYKIAADLWPVEVDIGELELSLVNIAVNARDAMPDGGTITLSADNVTLASEAPPGQAGGEFVALAMRDSGCGIPPDVLPRIFEPFFTTKAVGKGTGLGLSQVYGFARQAGGAVEATSEPGRGTTITVYLPRSHASPQLAPHPASPPTAVAREGSILLVEDSTEVAEVTASLLEQLGYRVTRATGAAEALQKMQDGAVDLVLSDIVMAGMNGIALARAMREQAPQVPILLMSGYSEALQAGEAEFAVLRKPFDLGTLEAAIQRAVQPGAQPSPVRAASG